MNGHDAHRLWLVCEEALAQPAEERNAFLDQACGEDRELRLAVDALLAEQSAGDFLAAPAWADERPRLAAGTHLGPYEVQSFIGGGGMGDVYKARDTRLGRTVAIKVLPPDLAAHPERRRRFEQEARAASALNDPHICTLHDIGSDNGTDYLVMEYLEGETLAARLHRGRLPLDQALDYATQIADALSKAHRQGIVHRDLKPGNIMLTKSGAKLLDFGLAKLRVATAASALGATTAATIDPSTEKGVLLGTVPYMAPEQLEGKDADARSDIFAFGAVLYEMLSGRRAFEGETPASVAAAILEHEPAPIARERAVPPPLDHLMRQCLAKSPDDRPDTAHDVTNQLRWVKETSGVAPTSARPRRRLRTRAMFAAACLVAGVFVGVLVMWLLRPAPVLVTRPSLDVRPADELTSSGSPVVGGNAWASPTPGGSRTAFAWTSNGRALVFIGRQAGVQRLYVRQLGDAEARPIANTDGAEMLAVSPDGQRVAFWANGKISRVRLDGGPATEASSYTAPAPPRGLAWGEGGLFHDSFAPEAVIWQIPEGQGAPKPVTHLRKGDFQHILPWPLPGGRAILYTLRKRLLSWRGEEIVVETLATGERKLLLRDAVDARYVASGHLVFLRQGRLFAVPFDPERLEKTGDELPVLEIVAQALTGSSADASGAGQYAVSSTGHLAWVPSAAASYPLGSLVTVDRQGRVTRLPADAQPYGGVVRLSPDGRQLAVGISALNERGLWVYDLDRPNLTPRPVHRGDDATWPAWSRDNRQIAFLLINNSFSLVTKPADSDPSARPTVWMAQRGPCPASFSRDGDILGVRGYVDIVVVTREGTLRPLIATPGTSELYPDLSADGRWLAYASDGSGRMEVHVTRYPDVRPADALVVSVGGGDSPAWHPNGRELFFLSPPTSTGLRQMMAADFSPGPPPRVGRPHMLFEFDSERLAFAAMPLRSYQVGPDGQFYGVEFSTPRRAPVVTHINLIENWLEELKAKVPVRR